MIFKHLEINGVCLVIPEIYKDSRGYFSETYKQSVFEQNGISNRFVQDNESYSQKGVLRGLHMQTGDSAQAKLVRVPHGIVTDVVVDLRPSSATFSKHIKVELSSINKHQLFIPKGCAHGFIVMSDDAVLSYKCDNYYDSNSETGIIYSDPDLAIEWPELACDYKLSKKDRELPTLKEWFKKV